MREREYNRQKAIDYAHKWAYRRNPQYYNFDPLGGDCTNFISQCLYEGSSIMNYDKEKGWYYRNGNDKSPSWTGVEFLYQFLINNKSVGPYGKEVKKEEVEPGDIIQISFNGNTYAHSLLVVNKIESNIYITSHTFDSDNRNLETYSYRKLRGIKIQGVRIW